MTSEAPLVCPLSSVSVMMKDVRAEVRKQQELRRQINCRLRRAGLLRRRQPKKKSNRAQSTENKCMQTLPVLLPHVLFKNMVCSGLIAELMLAGIWHCMCMHIDSNRCSCCGDVVMF